MRDLTCISLDLKRKNMINPLEFQKSINRELQVVKNRVRNLIGNANWGDEGSYKEAIFRIIGFVSLQGTRKS